MQKCDNCKKEFSWRKIYKSFWTIKFKPIYYCNDCRTEYRVSNKGRVTNASLTLWPFLFFSMILAPFDKSILNLIVGLVIFILGSLLAPYFVEFEAVFKDETQI